MVKTRNKIMKNIYFISDLHLGYPDDETSRKREKKIVGWLESIKNDCEQLFLVGDVFDFWHEWKYVIPKGFTRFLGKLAEFSDSGIPIHFFTGNHDIWTYSYLKDELNIQIYRKPELFEFSGKKFYIAHGDGLGPFDWQYKILKKIFTSRFLQWCFARLHPNFSMFFGLGWSRANKYREKKLKFQAEKEWLLLYSRELLKQQPEINYFIYGHRHVPVFYPLNNEATFINLGQWISQFNYGIFDGQKMKLEKAILL